nr:retrotransposon protein, putative, Ty1-copia subclass [Tanacetum cinerariifolium]
ESLERKYKTEDAGTKKFVIARFLDYKMVDSKNKFQGTCYNCDQPGHRAANCKMPKRVNPRQENMMNDDVDMIAMVFDVCAMISKKFQGTCYNCDQPDHRAANCKMPKRVNPRQENMMNDDVDMIAMVFDVCAMISKSMFHSFKAIDNGPKLYMGNYATADIKGEGDVVLKMTSEKELKLTNVLYVLEIRKNLVFGWQLNKFGFRLVFESDKFVLSKNQMYVGRCYAMNGMFKLNVMIVKNEINKMNSSAYLIKSSNVWHGRLGHETGSSSRLDDEVVQGKRQRDENDLQVERQDQVEEVIEPQRVKRARTEKSFGPDFVSFMVENKPTSYQEAELVDLPSDCKPLGYKWIFKKKMKADGTIDKYKARLVIKEFRQHEGLNYFDTYSPVTRITSIRMRLAIAALRNLEVHQMDVKTAFPNRDLEEEIYINQPEGFIALDKRARFVDLLSHCMA